MWKSRFAASAALVLAMTLPVSALADSAEIDHLKQENAEMKQMLMQMQEQLQEVILKTNAMQQQAKKAAEGGDEKGGMVKSKKEDITISTTGGGIQVKSSKGNAFKIGGWLMYDHDSYDDFWGEDAEENEIRRSRITLSGNSGEHWSYKFTANIDHEGKDEDGKADEDFIDTGYIKYSSKPMYAKLGKFDRPAMLEERTSSKWISTIERSIVNELSGAVVGKPSFGGIEVGFGSKGDMPVSGAIGVYDDEIEENDGGDVYGIGARYSIMPKLSDNSFLHAGASFYTVDYKGNDYRMRTRMGVHTAGHPFETGQHKTEDVNQIGVELAYVNGPFSLQGEFMNVESDGTNNAACGSGVYTPVVTTEAVTEEQEEKYLVVRAKRPGDNPDTAGVVETDYQIDYDVEVDLGENVDLSAYTGCDADAAIGNCESFGANPHVDAGMTGTVPDTVGGNKTDDYIVRKRTVEVVTTPASMTEEMFAGFGNTCDIEMDGFYLQAAYTLTGETRGYIAGSGAFAAINPKAVGGAWEVVARYEDADIDIPGRSLSADLERLVLGVNWYATKNVKFMLNYVDSEVDCSTTTRMYALSDGTASNKSKTLGIGPVEDGKHKGCNYGKKDKEDGNAISLRGQYVF